MIVQVHVCIKPHLFIGETAFSNLFMAGLDEDGRDLMIASAFSNNKRAEYDLEKDETVLKRTLISLGIVTDLTLGIAAALCTSYMYMYVACMHAIVE